MRLILLGVLLCTGCSVFATELPVEPVAANSVSVDFSVVGWGGEIKNLAYLNKNRLIRLGVAEFVPSTYYSYAGPAKMDLYRMDDAAVASVDALKDRRVGSVTFDPELKKATVLLSKMGDGYAAIVIPADTEKFPVGQARLQNLSSKSVSILCNKRTLVTIGPGEVQWVKPDDKSILDADMAYQESDRWVRFERSYFPVLKTQQTAIFFLKSDSNFFKTANGASVGGGVQVLTLRFPLGEAK